MGASCVLPSVASSTGRTVCTLVNILDSWLKSQNKLYSGMMFQPKITELFASFSFLLFYSCKKVH